MKWSNEQRIVIAVSCVLAAIVALVWLGVILGGENFVAKTMEGQGPFAHLRRGAMHLLHGVPAEQHHAELLARVHRYAGHLTTIYLVCQSILLIGSLRRPNLFRDFFHGESHPLNLAILRIVFFLTLFPRVSLNKVIQLSQVSADLRVAPPGLSWFVANLPESELFITTVYAIFGASCIAGVLGMFTRTACLTATVCALYLMGVPQCFGKISHHHHIIWIGALLSVSRCADVLTVDAVWQALRGRPIEAGTRSTAYGLPIRFVWLFLGVLYFFPGFWKYVISGPQWFLSDNLQARMWLRMFVSPGWSPVFRADQFHLLSKVAGLTTIVWEIGFVFLVFSRWGRYVAAAGGLLFHTLVKWLLNISFWPMQAYYVVFFEWDKLLHGLARRVYRDPLVIEVEPGHAVAERLVAVMRSLDLFDTFSVQPTATPLPSEALGIRSADNVGFDVVKAAAKRSPLIWLAVPFVRLASRHRSDRPVALCSRRRGVLAVGTTVLVVNTLCGFTMLDTWPFGVYPTFARVIEPGFQSLGIDALDAEGSVVATIEVYFDPAFREVYSRDKLTGAIQMAIQRGKQGDLKRLLSLWEIWHKRHGAVAGVARLNFYLVDYSTRPEEFEQNPLGRKLFQTADVERRAGGPVP